MRNGIMSIHSLMRRRNGIGPKFKNLDRLEIQNKQKYIATYCNLYFNILYYVYIKLSSVSSTTENRNRDLSPSELKTLISEYRPEELILES
jgi:hypothetical protein